MQKIIVCFFFFILLGMCGCKPYANPQYSDANWVESIQTHSAKYPPLIGEFSVQATDIPASEKIDEPAYPPIATLPYPWVVCEFQFKNLEVGKKYQLYCPNTGCPYFPEYELCFFLNDENAIQILSTTAPSSLIIKTVRLSMRAIPNFCSDWYLVSGDYKKIAHTTFIHQPTQVKSSTDQQIMLLRKEAGGNAYEIHLSGFQPNQAISLTLQTQEDTEHLNIAADEQGFAIARWASQKKCRAAKGRLTVLVPLEKENLEISDTWDKATLSIPKKQPYWSLTRLLFYCRIM